MIRFLDVCISVVLLLILMPAMVCIYFICFFETRSAIFFQVRLGLNQKTFTLYKFRTMHEGTKNLPTHLIGSDCLTRSGKILRKLKLDELPQLFNVLKGDMSLVGPRPGLPCHQILRSAREECGVFNVRPGITGLSQVTGVDMSTPEILAKTDREMIEGLTLYRYFYYLLATFIGRGNGDRIKGF